MWPVGNLGRDHAEGPKQPRHQILRMGLVLFDCLPFIVSAGTVEARKNYRSLVEHRDYRNQLGQRRDAADQSRGDDRIARARASPDLGLALEQPVSPLCGVEGTLLGENPGPMLRQNFQKALYDLP